MEGNTCTMYNIEKRQQFSQNSKDCKTCNIIRNLKRYYENVDKISNQQKIYCENIPSQKQIER